MQEQCLAGRRQLGLNFLLASAVQSSELHNLRLDKHFQFLSWSILTKTQSHYIESPPAVRCRRKHTDIGMQANQVAKSTCEARSDVLKYTSSQHTSSVRTPRSSREKHLLVDAPAEPGCTNKCASFDEAHCSAKRRPNLHHTEVVSLPETTVKLSSEICAKGPVARRSHGVVANQRLSAAETSGRAHTIWEGCDILEACSHDIPRFIRMMIRVGAIPYECQVSVDN